MNELNKLVIKTTPIFDRLAKKLVTIDSLEELYDYLQGHPEAGDLIQGASGVRKLRWRSSKNNKGKSGGLRILYHYSKNILIIMIGIYSKSEKENISPAERNELKRLIPQMVAKYREDL